MRNGSDPQSAWISRPSSAWLAITGIMPTWAIVGDHVVFGSGIELCDLGMNRLASKGADGKSLLNAEGFKRAAGELPKNLLSLTYADSSVQFNQSLMQGRC